METRARTIAKTVSWRIFGVMITALIAWKLTGDTAIGIKIGFLDCFIKVVLFYLHERAWNKIKFGYRLPSEVRLLKEETQRTLVSAGSVYGDIER